MKQDAMLERPIWQRNKGNFQPVASEVLNPSNNYMNDLEMDPPSVELWDEIPAVDNALIIACERP